MQRKDSVVSHPFVTVLKSILTIIGRFQAAKSTFNRKKNSFGETFFSHKKQEKRELPFMTSANFSGYPSPLSLQDSRNLSVLSSAYEPTPLPPQCGRHKLRPLNSIWIFSFIHQLCRGFTSHGFINEFMQ